MHCAGCGEKLRTHYKYCGNPSGALDQQRDYSRCRSRAYRARKQAEREDHKRQQHVYEYVRELESVIVSMRDEIAALRVELAHRPASTSSRQEKAQPRITQTPQALDDLQLDIKQQSRDADNNPTWNFMIASTLQIYGKCDVLPSEIIAYGLRTKRIPPHAVTQPLKKPVKPQLEVASGGPKAMDVPQFAPPSFDDDLLDLL